MYLAIQKLNMLLSFSTCPALLIQLPEVITIFLQIDLNLLIALLQHVLTSEFVQPGLEVVHDIDRVVFRRLLAKRFPIFVSAHQFECNHIVTLRFLLQVFFSLLVTFQFI